MSEIRAALTTAEDFLKQAAAATGERASELTDKGLKALRQAQMMATQLQETVKQKSKDAARIADDYVHEYPWQAIGIASLLGLVLGLILSRK